MFPSCVFVDILNCGEDGSPVIEWDEWNRTLLTVPDKT